jgi:hypothetical protein
MTILASEEDKQKVEMVVSQARSRNYPILGAHQQLVSPSCIKMGD